MREEGWGRVMEKEQGEGEEGGKEQRSTYSLPAVSSCRISASLVRATSEIVAGLLRCAVADVAAV